MDLNERNILLDDEGKIWLINWDLAGAYPPREGRIIEVDVVREEWDGTGKGMAKVVAVVGDNGVRVVLDYEAVTEDGVLRMA